ncbi:hypothetical protein C9J01_23110 [Photobacterium rosenbergii]|uniref:Thiol:disulfide interchange protein n=1 Tax=Photobacterium rosenbergii TaxID=294936 RepID=A0A2T3N6V0_9GAMM|nr:hypothetical protein [Photobacterium rosenbergii]PSW08518.1 hypothetical protein C9J01_23110 [Photobacterium rosenbergii]
MKTNSLITMVFWMLLAAQVNAATKPIEGIHYETVDTTGDIKLAPVTEIFALGCHACHSLEQIFARLAKRIEQPIDKVHVVYNRPTEMQASLYYTGRLMVTPDKLDAFTADLFDAMQSGGSAEVRLNEAMKTIKRYSKGDDAKTAKRNVKAIKAEVDRAKHISTAYEVNAVPSLVINSKYVVLFQAHKSEEDIASTVIALLDK